MASPVWLESYFPLSTCLFMTTDPLQTLRGELDVDLRDDELHRRLYAQDASIYEDEPLGAVFPRNAADLQSIVELAHDLEIPLVPRGGGTSLAGQCVGEGLVVDVGRHMDGILEVDPDEQWARVQPGVVQDDLNRHLEDHGLMFGPDTSTSNQAQIGGMIGNNSCGTHSIRHGTTRDHIREMEVVFGDGTRETIRPWSHEEYQHHRERDDALGEGLRAIEQGIDGRREEIRDRYPRADLLRRNTGYPFDEFLDAVPFDDDGRRFPIERFLCGSEGTLGFVAEATIDLVERPGTNLLMCAHFEGLEEALRATQTAVEHDPAAVELMDQRILRLTEDHPEQQKNRFFVEGDPGAILVIECYGDDEADVESQAREIERHLEDEDLGFAYPRVPPPRDTQVWKLRKAGLGILMGMQGDTKPVTVVEDTAVGVDDLPDYARDFADVMDDYSTQCVYYAHVSVGELHLRPELNLKDEEEAGKFEDIAHDVAELVDDYDGSLSGEHGDGRVRSPLLETFYGESIVELHEEVKRAFDPKGLLNPGNIVDPEPIDEDWRVEPGEAATDIETVLDWSEDGGLLRSVEKCNGVGLCRRSADADGTMCPSYKATGEERDTTRGRANVFRQLLRGDEPADAFDSEVLHEAMDLCLSCKACKTECPANVDMARMKAEFSQRYHDRNGTPWSAHLFGRYRTFARMAAIWPAFANWVAGWALTRWILQSWVSVTSERQLPEFASTGFSRRFARHDPPEDLADDAPTVWLYVDPFVEYNEPEIGMAAVRVLEAGGYRVERFPIEDDGRTLISKGMLRLARDLSNDNMATVASLLDDHSDRPVVGLEPSALLTFRDETPDLVDDEWREAAEDLADRSLLFEEFVEQACLDGAFGADWRRDDELGAIKLHGHCHQTTLVGTEPTEHVLEVAGYDVETIPSGCCGMAGSFGYEADHYDISMEIGELTLLPAVREADEATHIAAPGTSCRDQIQHGADREAEHPAVLLEQALAE